MACDECGKELCADIKARRVKLAYVSDKPTYLGLFNAIDNSELDMTPIIQSGETDTKLELVAEEGMIRYFPEKWLSSEGEEGCVYNICIKDLAELINLDDLGDVDATDPSTGMVIRFNDDTKHWELFDLDEALDGINIRLMQLENDVANMTQTINKLTQQLENLFDSIYGWPLTNGDKIVTGNMRLDFSTNNVATYDKYIHAADDNGNNVIRGRVH